MTSKDLTDPNWWRYKSRSLAWFNANVMPHGWTDKFHDFGLMHHQICDHLDPTVNTNTKKYLSAFRGSHKTTQLHGFMVWFFCWNLAKKVSNSLVYNTATKDNAFNMQADIKQSLLHNDVLQWMFPELPKNEMAYDAMTQKRIEHRNVRLDFTSLETTLVSRHYPVWINDDLENDENCRTDFQREELKRKWRYQKAILTRIRKRGVGLEIEVGTPYNMNGLTWMIRNMPKYSKLEIPCYINSDKKQGVTFPELYTVEDFEDKLEDMGTTIFAAQFLLRPLAEEDALCPEHWVRHWKQTPDCRWRSMVIDPGGYGLKSGPGLSDATGITIVDTDENATIYMIYADEHFLTPTKLLETIINLKRTFDPDDMRIEKEKFSTTIADIWEHKYPELNISYVQHAGRPKGDKDNQFNTRIWRLKQWFETKRILLAPEMVSGHPFYDQLISFPDTTTRRVDMLDSLAYQLDIRRIPKRKGKIILPSGKELNPSIDPSFEEEFDKSMKVKREREEARFDDANF